MPKRDRKKIQYCLASMVISFIMANGYVFSSAYADVGGGGDDVIFISSTIHKVAHIGSLSKEFNEFIQDYNKKKMECSKIIDHKERMECLSIAEKILEKAEDILAKLNQQANSVESEIAINKKKVDKRFAKQLDRLLIFVVKTRQEANKIMKSSIGSS